MSNREPAQRTGDGRFIVVDGRRWRAAAAPRALLRHRDGTVCPSHIARVIDGKRWRLLLPPVRRVARRLTAAGVLAVQQKGQPVTGRPGGRFASPADRDSP